VDSSSLFKFVEGDVEAENIIRITQWKFLIAYLKITSLGSSYLRVEGKADALVAISSAIMRRSLRMAKTHPLMKITIVPRTYSMIKRMTGNTIHQGNGQLFKESKEPQFFTTPHQIHGCTL